MMDGLKGCGHPVFWQGKHLLLAEKEGAIGNKGNIVELTHGSTERRRICVNHVWEE